MADRGLTGGYNPYSQGDLNQQLRNEQMRQFAAVMGQNAFASVGSPANSKGGETMLEKLKNLTQTLALKGAVDAELAAFGRALDAEYKAQGIPAPKWLAANLKALSQEIQARWKAERRAQLAAAEKEVEELRSREEKRAAKEEEIRKLREELGE